ncbi:MAG TPA: hypothetical protein VFA03_13170 [Acetobacteraceae bacterium]|nr:hypothetical protein [Acetobacteraceae bacterium]
MMRLQQIERDAAVRAAAPDGSEVRVLCRGKMASMAEFSLPAGAVSRAVAHRTVEELWFVVSGSGQMWRRIGDEASVVALHPGLSLSIPLGAHFQFRADQGAPLVAIGATMPPWPGPDEAYPVAGPWEASA